MTATYILYINHEKLLHLSKCRVQSYCTTYGKHKFKKSLNIIHIQFMSSILSFEFPTPFLSREPVEVTDVPKQFSEHWSLSGGQSRSEILQDLPSVGLAINLSLEGHKVPQIHQQLIMLSSGSMWSGRLCSLLVIIFFFIMALR